MGGRDDKPGNAVYTYNRVTRGFAAAHLTGRGYGRDIAAVDSIKAGFWTLRENYAARAGGAPVA